MNKLACLCCFFKPFLQLSLVVCSRVFLLLVLSLESERRLDHYELSMLWVIVHLYYNATVPQLAAFG